MKDNALISKLRDVLGLTEYEAKAYMTLATLGEMTVGELSSISGVPRAKCYEVLKGLVTKGLVVTISSRPAKYKPVPVEEGIRNRMNQLKNEMQRKFSEAKELLTELRELRRKDSTETEREVRVMLIENHTAIVSSSIRDALKAKEEILIAISQKPAKINWDDYSKQVLKSLCKGVRFKFVVPSVGIFTKRMKEILGTAKIKNMGIEIREYGKIRMPFVIIDNKITYLYITDPKAGVLRMAIRVADPRMADQMRDVFNRYWELSERAVLQPKSE